MEFFLYKMLIFWYFEIWAYFRVYNAKIIHKIQMYSFKHFKLKLNTYYIFNLSSAASTKYSGVLKWC